MVKVLSNIVRRFQEVIDYYWKQITTNMPLRMRVGRFGIWLVKVGRALQVRYANWNSEFRLEHKLIPIVNFGIFHVSDIVTDKEVLSFFSRNSQPSFRTPLVDALFEIRGVARVTLKPYRIEIEKASVFTWQELLPDIERVILEHLTA